MGFDLAHDELGADDGSDRDHGGLILDPDAPDFHPRRFRAVCYRTARAVLMMKGHLVLGQAIGDVSETLTSEALIRDPEEHFSGHRTPACPEGLTSQEDFAAWTRLHTYLAIKIGVDPNDPVLDYLEDPELAPTKEELLEFEAGVLWTAGPVLQAHGRLRAYNAVSALLGGCSLLERRDFTALPYAWVREMRAVGSEEERQLQVLRLEDLANRAGEALDIRAELAARRELNTILGLKFRDDERGQRELIALLGQPRQPPKQLEDR